MQVPFTEMGKDEAGAGLVGVGVKLGAQPNMYEAGVVYDTSQWECPGDHWTHESISGERSRLEIEMGGLSPAQVLPVLFTRESFG